MAQALAKQKIRIRLKAFDYKLIDQSALEIVGLGDTRLTVCTGVEMFRKLLDQGQAGDNVGVLLRGTKREEVERGMVLC